MTVECDISPLTMSCVRCGAKVSSPSVRRNCAVASKDFSEEKSVEPRAALPPMLTHPRGPGTELKKLLMTMGITASPTCSCNARASLMDENEASKPGWCEAHMEEIVGWLREEATKRGLPFLDAAGRLLVRRAIANARRLA